MRALLRRYLPPALGITALYLLNRFFKARFIAHNIDSDFRCCESVLTL